ncbi:MAG: DUF2905 domain-containing protein [Anaerolineaceae bacterium]|nr:DUF2905 domain-containing protein [Anaerolineaceae bacterium]
MENVSMIGRLLVLLGLSLAVLGGLLWLMGRIPGLDKFPGTISFEGSGLTCVIPIVGSILLSIILTIGLNILLRVINK